MNTKNLYYREIGEAPQLRRIHNTAKKNKLSNKLDIACEYLMDCLQNPAYIQNYEMKLSKVVSYD